MRPILLAVGPVTIYGYGTCAAAAYLAGLALALRRGRRRGYSPSLVVALSLWTMSAGIVGARVPPVIAGISEGRPVAVVFLHSSGASLWGIMAGTAAGLAVARRRGLPFAGVADLCAPSVALGIAIGKCGCFLAGCCYGKPTDAAWGISLPTSSLYLVSAPVGVALHPVQLYEGGAAMAALLTVLSIERMTPGWPGRTFWLLTVLYSCARFALEEFRGASHIFRLSEAQIITMSLVALGVVMLRVRPGKVHNGTIRG